MKNYSKIILGLLLIVVGVLFLANNYNWFDVDISFHQIAKWWPLLLVVGGLGVFLNPSRSLGNPLSVLAISFAIPLAIFSLANDGIDKLNTKMDKRYESDEFADERFEDNTDSKRFDNESSESSRRVTQHFEVSNEIGIKKATLDFGGGASGFYLEPTTDYLFEANTMLTKGSYKLDSDRSADEMDINFEMVDQKGGHFSINENSDFDNDVYLKLNPKVIWDIKMGIGAGDLQFDLSKFKIEKVKIETGVASVKLKLSDLLEESQIEVKSGVAKVSLDIPEGVGCRIDLDGAMNKKSFVGFDKVGNDRWETPNFNSASKKIYIDLESGLSSINVSRY